MHTFYMSYRGRSRQDLYMKKGKRDGEKLGLDITSLYKSPTEREIDI